MNVSAKNLIVFALSSVALWVIGFGLMFSKGNNFIGMDGFFLTGADNSPATGDAYFSISPDFRRKSNNFRSLMPYDADS